MEGVQAEAGGLVLGPAGVVLVEADALVGVIAELGQKALHLRRARRVGLAGLLHALGEQIKRERLAGGGGLRGWLGGSAVLREGRRRQQGRGHGAAERADHRAAGECGAGAGGLTVRAGQSFQGHMSRFMSLITK